MEYEWQTYDLNDVAGGEVAEVSNDLIVSTSILYCDTLEYVQARFSTIRKRRSLRISIAMLYITRTLLQVCEQMRFSVQVEELSPRLGEDLDFISIPWKKSRVHAA